MLQKYADVFSSGDLDLGHTNLVKHHINTGNHPPIKQPPRRVAPVWHQEMEKAVDELSSRDWWRSQAALGH